MMTLDEARKVAAIIDHADGGCSECVEELRRLCQEAFPQLEWTTDDWGTTVFVKDRE